MSRRGVLAGLAGAALAPTTVEAHPDPRRAQDFFVVTQQDVALTALDPAHDGLRVVQLSDIHLGEGMPEARIAKAIEAVNGLEPDLVVLTGDFITTRRDPVSKVSELLAQLGGGPQPVAVLGNHDHWTYPDVISRSLEALGISVLRNQRTTVRLKGVDFTITGVDDSTSRQDDVAAAFRDEAAAPSHLVLTHTPSCARKLPEDRGVLVLSGHTHGGQMEVPGLTRALFTTAGQPWYRGGYAVRGNQLYVNRGLGFGNGTRAPRLNSDPEVTVLTLGHRPRVG